MTLTDEQFAVADRIAETLEAEPLRLWSPSALARKVRATYGDTYAALLWMEEQVFIIGEGNGAWRKYRARRFGEYGARP